MSSKYHAKCTEPAKFPFQPRTNSPSRSPRRGGSASPSRSPSGESPRQKQGGVNTVQLYEAKLKQMENRLEFERGLWQRREKQLVEENSRRSLLSVEQEVPPTSRPTPRQDPSMRQMNNTISFLQNALEEERRESERVQVEMKVRISELESDLTQQRRMNDEQPPRRVNDSESLSMVDLQQDRDGSIMWLGDEEYSGGGGRSEDKRKLQNHAMEVLRLRDRITELETELRDTKRKMVRNDMAVVAQQLAKTQARSSGSVKEQKQLDHAAAPKAVATRNYWAQTDVVRTEWGPDGPIHPSPTKSGEDEGLEEEIEELTDMLEGKKQEIHALKNERQEMQEELAWLRDENQELETERVSLCKKLKDISYKHDLLLQQLDRSSSRRAGSRSPGGEGSPGSSVWEHPAGTPLRKGAAGQELFMQPDDVNSPTRSPHARPLSSRSRSKKSPASATKKTKKAERFFVSL